MNPKNNQQHGKELELKSAELPAYIPSCDAIEAAVIGAMLSNSQTFDLVLHSVGLRADDFYSARCSMAFACMADIKKDANAKIDLLTVTQKAIQLFPDKLTAYDVVEFTNNVASTANVEYHARIVQQYAIRRKLFLATSETRQKCLDVSNDIFELIASVEQSTKLMQQFVKNNQVQMIDVLNAQDLVIETGYVSKKIIPTGIRDIDNAGTGIEERDIIAIVAESGVGKTALMVNMLVSMLDNKQHCAVFSYEMEAEEIMTRIVSVKSGLSGNDIEYSRLSDIQKQEYRKASEWLRGNLEYLSFFDCVGQTIDQLRSEAISLHSRKKIECIFVDYLQAISFSHQYGSNTIAGEENRAQKLQQLRKELKCPMIVAAQLKKLDKSSARPYVKDVKGAQGFEAILTKAFVLDDKDKRGITEFEDGTPTKGYIELFCDKARKGARFACRLQYTGHNYRFYSQADVLESEWQDMQQAQLAQSSLHNFESRFDGANIADEIPF
jgi:replicative DNA helicase